MGWLGAILLLASAAPAKPQPAAPPKDNPNGPIYAAIWNDLQLNAFIGNGNGLAALWYGGEHLPMDGSGKESHIEYLVCKGQPDPTRCSFTLRREGGPVESLSGDIAPGILLCRANFYRDEDGAIAIHHGPPDPRGDHSRTTMKCRKATTGT